LERESAQNFIVCMDLRSKVRETIFKYKMFSSGEKVLVAVSGGPDSVALLHLLHGLREEMDLRLEVAHLQHGIRGEEGREDALFVARIAARLALPFHLKEVDLPGVKAQRGRGNLEAMGREERYGYFAALAKAEPLCQLLMSAPGVGPLTASAYVATIDDPHRFRRSEQVGAYVGIVPRIYQSGDTAYLGRITKEGDRLLRWLLVEAAHCLLTHTKKDCTLKRWGLQLQARKGAGKAKVAVARKLAVILHRMWITGEKFDWQRA